MTAKARDPHGASGPGSPPGAGEHFIPYSMIEPLLEEGMTGNEMTGRVLARIGLDYARYTLVALDVKDPHAALSEIVRQGLYVMTNEQARAIGALRHGHELVR